MSNDSESDSNVQRLWPLSSRHRLALGTSVLKRESNSDHTTGRRSRWLAPAILFLATSACSSEPSEAANVEGPPDTANPADQMISPGEQPNTPSGTAGAGAAPEQVVAPPTTGNSQPIAPPVVAPADPVVAPADPVVQDEPVVPASLAGSRPNIILVMTDDQGMGDLSLTGNTHLKTPRIDAFAEASTRFTDFHVSPTCAPTRAAMMSGRRPFEVGVTHTIRHRERMARAVKTFPEALQGAGYQTAQFGKWHHGDQKAYRPQSRGFNEVLMHGAGGIGQDRWGDFTVNSNNVYFDNVLMHNDTIVKTKGFCTDLFFDAALAWIKVQKETPDPYFAYVSLNAPHLPLVAPEADKRRFQQAGYDKDSTGRYGMIENIDSNFGRMMDTLERWGALDNTLVIFMTDNGMAMEPFRVGNKTVQPFNAGLRGKKNDAFEGGTRVPAFWYWKDRLKGGDVDALVAHIDLYRTFTELAGAEIPESPLTPSGRSMVPLLEDSAADWEDRSLIFHRGRWNGPRAAARYQHAAVRSKQWRLVFNGNQTFLSDIQKDPGERNNVAGANPEVVREMKATYDAWWASVDDFLVNEGLNGVAGKDQPFNVEYRAQQARMGIPNWAPDL